MTLTRQKTYVEEKNLIENNFGLKITLFFIQIAYPNGDVLIERATMDEATNHMKLIDDAVGITESGYISSWNFYAQRAPHEVITLSYLLIFRFMKDPLLYKK